MYPVKAKLSKLSLCECGFPVLKDEIQLGAEYELLLEDQGTAEMMCGGCKKWIPIKTVLVTKPGGPGYLPIDIFELKAKPEGLRKYMDEGMSERFDDINLQNERFRA